MAERLDGSDDAPDVLTSVRPAAHTATGGARSEAAGEPVNQTAVTGEMPLVLPAVSADDTTADALPAFTEADLADAGAQSSFENSEPTGPIAFAAAQALLQGAPTGAVNSPRVPTPEEVDALLAPARAAGLVARQRIIEDLGGSYPANLAATLLGMSEADLRSSGLIILPDDEVPEFQIRRGKPLAGIAEVANAFRAAHPEDTAYDMLLQFCADYLRELGGRSPVQALKAAHDLALQAGGDTSATINKVVELARKYPQAGIYAIDPQYL